MKKYILPYSLFIISLVGFSYAFLFIGFLLGYADSARDMRKEWNILYILLMSLNLMLFVFIYKYYFKLILNLYLFLITLSIYIILYFYLLNNT